MKVLLLQNNQNWATMPEKLAQIKAWFAPKVNIEFTVEQTSFKNIPWIGTAPNQFVDSAWFDGNITFPALKRGYDVVLLVLEPSVWKSERVQGWGTIPNIGIEEICMLGNEFAEYVFEDKHYWTGQFFNIVCHELCHRIFNMLGKTDTTHYYYRNGRLDLLLKELEEPKTNPAVEFYRNPIPQVTITRKTDNGIQTIGELSVGDFKCFTLERPDKKNKQNISCIPKGMYAVKWTFSPRLLRFTYEVTGVPKRSGIRFHSANYYTDLNGCISLGDSLKDINSDKQVDILNSKLTIKKFETLLNKKDFKLVIK